MNLVLDELILIDKPPAMTSFGVVARVRRVLSQQAGRKVKVGHTGTLDPFATGLMIVLTGQLCKQAERFSRLDKSYQAEITLGQTSSTGDPEGELSQVSAVQPTRQQIDEVVGQFIGQIKQTPPAYSAIKIGGQRAYKLAREGKAVEMPVRTVEIYSLKVINYDYPRLTIEAAVSSGTYIRSLAEDIGQALGTGAYCSALRRTRVGDHYIEDAKSLSDLGITS